MWHNRQYHKHSICYYGGTASMEFFIYLWTDKLTDKKYIGSHKGTIDDGYVSSSKYFNEEYNMRAGDFEREVLLIGTDYEHIREIEYRILKRLNAATNEEFYNRHNGGRTFICTGHSEETKKKLSKFSAKNFLGKHHSKETKEKISNTKTGKKIGTYSDSHKENISKGLKNKPKSLEHRQNLSKARIGKTPWNKGLKTGPLSKETKQKMREAHMGKIRGPMSEEAKQNISKAQKGRTPWDKGMKDYLSEETKLKKKKDIKKLSSNYKQWHGEKCKHKPKESI